MTEVQVFNVMLNEVEGLRAYLSEGATRALDRLAIDACGLSRLLPNDYGSNGQIRDAGLVHDAVLEALQGLQRKLEKS